MQKRLLILPITSILCLSLQAGAADKASSKVAEEQFDPATLPSLFKSNLVNYVKLMTRLTKQVDDQTDYRVMRAKFIQVKEAFDILDSQWPKGYAFSAQEMFARAHVYFNLAGRLYQYKVQQKDEPSEPNINDWELFQKHAGEKLIVQKYPKDYAVESARNKKFLPFDENITVLLNLGNEHFKAGRAIVSKQVD